MSQQIVPKTPSQWEDRYWSSADGLRLHYRYYAGPEKQQQAAVCPILCLPGLTRNARDFEDLAPLLARQHPVLAVNFRGRGDSAYAKDAMSYMPPTYAQDIVKLLDDLQFDKCAIVGTSLGGIVAMLMAATQPGRLSGVVLNDIGPEIDPVGLARIANYVGVQGPQPTWMHAARMIAETGAAIYPDFTLEDWLRMVKRSHRLTPEGRIVADYDRRIAEPFRASGSDGAFNLWPIFDALKAAKLLIVRGGASDLFAAKTADKMVKTHGAAQLVTLPKIGHAPSLDEPMAVQAIVQWAETLVA
jgi:pimeloyl-ACP methyl ester carboxylesterase